MPKSLYKDEYVTVQTVCSDQGPQVGLACVDRSSQAAEGTTPAPLSSLPS